MGTLGALTTLQTAPKQPGGPGAPGLASGDTAPSFCKWLSSERQTAGKATTQWPYGSHELRVLLNPREVGVFQEGHQGPPRPPGTTPW